jgi:hypothetical protein
LSYEHPYSPNLAVRVSTDVAPLPPDQHMALASTTTIPTAVILKGQANYFSWDAWIRSQCPASLWKYFDPAENAEMKEPELPSTRPSYAEVFDEQLELKIAIQKQVLRARQRTRSQAVDDASQSETGDDPELDAAHLQKARDEADKATPKALREKKDDWDQEKDQYTILKSAWDRYATFEDKYRTIIIASVDPTIRDCAIEPTESIRSWFRSLLTYKPGGDEYQHQVEDKYKAFIKYKVLAWSGSIAKGPDPWILQWEKHLNNLKHAGILDNVRWLSDFRLVWLKAPGCADLCRDLATATGSTLTRQEIITRLRNAWLEESNHATMTTLTGSRITRTAFPAVFDGKQPAGDDGVEDEPESIFDDEDSSNPRKRSGTQTNANQTGANKKPSNNKNTRRSKTCIFCGGRKHLKDDCWLAGDCVPEGQVTPESQTKRFKENMKDPAFAKLVEAHREMLKAKRVLEESKK